MAVLWTFQGAHIGSGYEGLPPTGTRVEVRGITIWRIVDGRIVEEWSSFSETGGLHPNVCASEVVVSVCGVARPDHGDRYRASCLDDDQENVRLSAAQLNESGSMLGVTSLYHN